MTTSESPPSRYRRDRNSSWAVRVSDRVAQQIITIGGIGTILVVMLVVIVLLGNVVPLFQSNKATLLASLTFPSSDDLASNSDPTVDATPVVCGVDEYAEILWVLHRNGTIAVYSIDSGTLLNRYAPETGNTAESSVAVQCCAVADNDASLMAGYSDGTVRPIVLSLKVEFKKLGDMPASVTEELETGLALADGAIYRVMPSGLIRVLSIVDVVFHQPIAVFKKPIVCVDWRNPQVASSFDDSQSWAWGASDGESVALGTVENRANAFSGAVTQETKVWKHSPAASKNFVPIQGLMVGARSEHLQSIDNKGKVVVWTPTEGELLSAGLSHTSLAGTESKTTCTVPLLGRTTLMIGSESGHIESVATTARTMGQELQSIHQFGGRDGPVSDLIASPESRIVAAQFRSGKGAAYYVPTNRELVSWSLPSDSKPMTESTFFRARIFFSANAACVGFLNRDRVDIWRLQIPFPEASISSFFRPVWYEGYESPQHIWQSSTGNVEGEYKFGFLPLIFGTLKATFFSMLIGAPIALLAAIYGSEFMSRRWRARVKPFIELMASVPSVVLGFIGALVLAPLLRDNLMATLLSVIVVLFLFLLAAHLWLIIPGNLAIRLRRWRLPLLFLLIPIGLVISSFLAAPLELWLFQDDIVQWLSANEGSGWSGWFCLGLLPAAFVIAWLVAGPLSPFMQNYARRMTIARFSYVNLGIFIVATVATLVLSAVAASTLGFFGLDPRGSLLGPYQERNALLVGSILGFAIIPLIYTIAEDALQSVPEHLRSASLGCGATTWQTTFRVVIPTAMSGIFSALMIGFGRAVGETMVVLMAAGNTPVMDINPMNGYRTLSATLATELPEAARGSTHYHALFLAAFLLFCFTLVANTIAEVVRLRFRKRAYQL